MVGGYRWCCSSGDGSAEDVGNFGVRVEDGRSEFEGIVRSSSRGGRVLEKVQHILGCLLKVVISGELGEGVFFRKKVDFEDVAFCKGVGEVTLVAAVVFERRTDVPTDFAVFTKGWASIGGRVGDDSGAGRGERGAVEVEVTEQGGVGRQGRVDAGRPEQIEGQCGLREETVPLGKRKLGVNGAEDRDKVIFEGTDCSFGGIDPMFVWWDPLEPDLVAEERVFEVLGAFVVEDVEFGGMTVVDQHLVG